MNPLEIAADVADRLSEARAARRRILAPISVVWNGNILHVPPYRPVDISTPYARVLKDVGWPMVEWAANGVRARVSIASAP